jgi:hypothetical protein
VIQTHRQLSGIIHVTGEHDTGKTLFALQCGARPNKICFFDDDVKGRATIEQLKSSGVEFGAYYDLNELHRGKREVEFHQAIMGILDEIKPTQYEVIIFDTWTRFASTCRAMVLKSPNSYREHWSAMGKIKGAEQNQEATRLETQILGYLGTLAETVIVTTHLKDHYLNDARTGKQIPAGSKALESVPTFRIWLRMNPNGSPVPIGLVLKRPSKSFWSEGKQAIDTTNVMPRKIVPGDGDTSLWDVIWRYYENPIGDGQTSQPDEYELSILDGTLTKDQARTLRLMIERGLVGHDDEIAPVEAEARILTIGETVSIPERLRREREVNNG